MMADAQDQVSEVKPTNTKSLPLVTFARKQMGIELTPAQIEMLEWAAEGKTIIRARSMGLSTCREVARRWLEYGLRGNDLQPSDPDTKSRKAEA